MRWKLPRIAAALGIPGLAACVVAGCGGAGSAATTSSSAPVTRPQAVAYAHAVNLQAADLPDLRVSTLERAAKIEPHEGVFARCVGESDPRREIAKFKSATFKYPASFGQLESSVTVQPTQALALSNFRAALQPRLLTCLKNLLPVALAGKAERTIRYGPVNIARLSGLPVPETTGVSIRTSVIAPRLPYPVPVYVDEFGFTAGRAEIALTTEGAPKPIPAEVEGRLLSLLYSRAKAHKL
jgi:hypothetical protein